ncbi:MAG: subclass B3 metallo-beta-lactamase [Terracidiphilus sp.]|jgi:metallo-beta-lactamase class B
MLKKLSRSILLFTLALASAVHLSADASWTTPFPPFRIAGNIYYVGSADLASYLIVTPKGLILINSSFEANVPLIEKSVAQLGFHFQDIKILLISHAHNDHCAGAAQVIKLTGAKYFVMDGDVPVVESGGKADFDYGAKSENWYPPAHVDRVLHDGDTVSLGGTVLTAHKTAGHTKGTTTWTLDEPGVPEVDNGRLLHVVIVGSPNVNPGYKLVNNKTYPKIATDYAHGFQVLKSLPCDIFLGAHGLYFDLKVKYPRWKAGDRNAFIDPDGYKAYVADRQKAFEDDLKRQTAGTSTTR